MVRESGYAERWLNPGTAIIRMKTIRETFGVKRASTDGRFKKEREAYATGVLALALEKLSNLQWWVEVETVEATPDTRLRRIDSSAGCNFIYTGPIGVVDWEENVDDIMEVIRKKCERAYPRDYLLLVNARHVGKVLRFDRITDEMEKISSPFLEVWVIASVGDDQMIAVRIAPGVIRVDFELNVELERASKRPAFLKKDIRGTTPGFRDLGLSFLPIPGRD